MDKISISHVVMYCKGWYKRSENVFDDLRKCLAFDGYSSEFFKDKDINRKLLSEVEKLQNPSITLYSFYDDVLEENCWRYGYYTKENIKLFNFNKDYKYKEYDADLAVMYWCMKTICHCNAVDAVMTIPDNNCLPIQASEQSMEDLKNTLNK